MHLPFLAQTNGMRLPAGIEGGNRIMRVGGAPHNISLQPLNRTDGHKAFNCGLTFSSLKEICKKWDFSFGFSTKHIYEYNNARISF